MTDESIGTIDTCSKHSHGFIHSQNKGQKVDDPLKRQQNRKANNKRPSASWVAQVKSCDKKKIEGYGRRVTGSF